MNRAPSLPWRALTRRSPSLPLRRAAPPARCYVDSCPELHSPHCFGRPLLSARTFTSSPARRKEKTPPPKQKQEQEQEEEQEKDSEQRPKSEESGKDNGKSSEEPTPIPPPSGNGSANAKPSSVAAGGGGGGSGGGGGGGGSAASGGGGDGGRKGKKGSGEKALQKPSIPDVYPQVMAIPIAKTPLFPGFYKAITIKDASAVAAIQEMMKRGQPYIGAFTLKDEVAEKDVIESMDDVYDVGVFAQVTSSFPVRGYENGLSAVLYPHRRIRMSSLLPPNAAERKAESESKAEKEEAPSEKQQGDVVASFEEGAAEQTHKDSHLFELTSFLRKYPVSIVNVDNITEEPYDKKSDVVRAVTSEIVSVFRDIANLSPFFRDQIATFSMSQSTGNVVEEPAKLADFAATVSGGDIKELQDILETTNVEERLSKSLVVLKKELINFQLQSKISKDVDEKIQKRQREYWLMEQMKGIRRELGIESDGKDKLVEKFKEKAEQLAMPEAVKKVFDEELNKLAHLETAAAEFNVTRNYLDWLTQIPWGKKSAETFGIKNATTVLNDDHHGLKDVKDRILEFIAVGKLRGTVEGKILCFVGPPGVGKTSIGKSIARALNREYYRFSVGGLTDVAEIKGHRRTYVGALPGRVIQALKKCQSENPLILIDEVDKIGRGHQGDPSSALLELLDPEQNNSFLDHYLDIPVDLSKVLFVCTANMTDTVPRALLDRMEIIELSGYVADEKMAIAERFLAPAAKEMCGLKDVDVSLQKESIEELIKSYCRESGVRNLKKQIEKVYRKAALKIIDDVGEQQPAVEASATVTSEASEASEAQATAEQKDETSGKESDAENSKTDQPPVAMHVPEDVHVSIGKDSLKDYVGPPVYTSDRLYDVTPPGVTMGLAWTSMGGAALYVESILESALSPTSQPSLEQTGNLMTVMKESSVIAYSFAKSLVAKDFPGNKFFEKAKLHLHCPEGAVQKDGMSNPAVVFLRADDE